MDWQQWVALTIVGVTAVAMAWSKLRPRKFSFQRDTHCGSCCAAHREAPQHSIVFRARKGERPQMIVKVK